MRLLASCITKEISCILYNKRDFSYNKRNSRKSLKQLSTKVSRVLINEKQVTNAKSSSVLFPY